MKTLLKRLNPFYQAIDKAFVAGMRRSAYNMGTYEHNSASWNSLKHLEGLDYVNDIRVETSLQEVVSGSYVRGKFQSTHPFRGTPDLWQFLPPGVKASTYGQSDSDGWRYGREITPMNDEFVQVSYRSKPNETYQFRSGSFYLRGDDLSRSKSTAMWRQQPLWTKE